MKLSAAAAAHEGDEDKQPPAFAWLEEAEVEDVVPDHAGCRCAAGSCERGSCPCNSARFVRDEQGHPLVLPAREPFSLELTACGQSCSCFGACGFSSAATWAVGLRKQGGGKGWGVHADKPLPAGALLGQYAGEYISTTEAATRLKEYDATGGGHALLVVREWLPSGTAALRLNIDATHRGNLARFLNHACDGGNLQLLLARRTGCLLPRVLFVTSRPVRQGEELTWCYGPPNPGPNGKPCYCGTSACLGFMPHEEV